MAFSGRRCKVTISALANMTGTEGQLRFHLGASMNTGFTEAQMKDFISVLETAVGEAQAESAQKLLAEVLKDREWRSPKEEAFHPANTVQFGISNERWGRIGEGRIRCALAIFQRDEPYCGYPESSCKVGMERGAVCVENDRDGSF